MKEENKLNGLALSEDELSQAADKVAVTEDKFSNAIDKTQEYTNNALNDELERLAQTFQTELKKAQAMSEDELIKSGIIIQQYEDDEGAIPESELCQCCGEQRRDKTFGENYEYCKACRNAMRKYPLSVSGLITLAVMVFVAVLSVFSFATDYAAYNTVRQGDDCVKENKLYSAYDSYYAAIEDFESRDVSAKKLYLKNAEILFHSMPEGAYSMSDITSLISSALSPLEASLPLYYNYVEMYEKTQVLYGTINEFYNVVNDEKYADYDFSTTEQYEEIMTAIGAIIDKQITVTSIDKKTSKLMASDEAMVRFCQYMFAYSNDNYADSYQYMNKIYELEPSYLWLYAYELGAAELQNGNIEKAQYFADALYESNYELPDAYALQSSIARMTGDSKAALEWAENGIKSDSTNAELYRIKAMALIADGEYEAAKKVTDEGMQIEGYGLLYMTAIVAENELGNKDTVKSLKTTMKENDIELSEKMNKYLKGKITAEEMFTEGTGDVQ